MNTSLTAAPDVRQGLVHLLHDRLMASASATAVLRELFGGPVEIRRMAGGPADPDDTLRAALAPQGLAVTHRRVTLVAAGRAVSEADLWYLPARLPPDMAETLATTTIPFGAVVAPLRPAREVLSYHFCAPGGRTMLEHRAVLRVDGLPIAAVHEHYLTASRGQLPA